MARAVEEIEDTELAAEQVIGQFFRLDAGMYRMVRTLGINRRGTGRPSTSQAIYQEAIKDYLEKHTAELSIGQKRRRA